MWLHVPNRPPEIAAGNLAGLSLCAGTGTLDEGISDALAGRYQAVGHIEREAYAASTLVARMEESSLDQAPVWDDIRSFDGRPWRGKVDIVSAGLPCQPYSVAGKRKGHADKRNLWDDFFRILYEVQPAMAFIENSPELVSRGWFEAIGERLCAMGFSIDAEIVGSKEVSAPHLRRRTFILAVADFYSSGLAYADSCGQQQGNRDLQAGQSDAQGEGGGLADSNISGCERQGIHVQRRGSQQAGPMPAWRFGVFPPPDLRGRDNRSPTLEEIYEAIPEWRRIAVEAPWLWPNMGAESLVRSMADGHAARMVASRTDRIRCVGNGVVPLSAALAFAVLARRLGLGRLVDWR